MIVLFSVYALNVFAQDYSASLTSFEHNMGTVKQTNGEKVEVELNFVRTDKTPPVVNVKYTINEKVNVCLDSFEQMARHEACLEWGVIYKTRNKSLTLNFINTLPLPVGVSESFKISLKQKKLTSPKVALEVIDTNGYYTYITNVKRNTVTIGIPYLF